MIEFDVKGVEEVNAFLKSIPLGATKEVTKAFGEYIIGNDQHGLRHYPPYRKVTRKQAYGVSFFSDKQRRWFFANLKDHIDIPYRQTWQLKDGWKLNYPSKNQATIKNRVPYASLVMGDVGQNRMAAKKGWRKVSKVVADNIKGAMRMANFALDRWLKAKNK